MQKRKRKPAQDRGPSPAMLEKAQRAIALIAMREGTTPEKVRNHIKIAMLNGLISEDPQIKAAWARIPRKGEVPTPEEVIAFYARTIQMRR